MYAKRFGARRILALSFLLGGAGLLALSFLQVDTPFWAMIVPTAAVGLAIIIAIYRNYETIDAEKIDLMKW